MKNELIKIEEPKLPIKWSYDISVKKVKVLVYKWKNITTDVIQELWVAREMLSKPGSHESGWGEYCKEIGVEQNTVNGWLRKYFVPVINHKEAPKLPEGKFNVIYADPPWSYNDKQDTKMLGGAIKHYPSMSIDELCNMQLPIANEAILFLWVTSPILEECFSVIRSWGFEYKASFVWDKIKHNMGHYNSVRHEFLLVCTKGSFTPQVKKLYDSVIQEEKTVKHSEKPAIVYEIIETLYPKGKYLELFSRNERKGWTMWGNGI